MSIAYSGKVKLEKLTASVELSDSRADVSNEYQLRNPSRRATTIKLAVVRPGIAGARVQTIGGIKPIFPKVTKSKLTSASLKQITTKFNASERRLFFMDYSTEVLGGSTKTFLYVPNLLADNSELVQKVPYSTVSIKLPPNAKKLVSSSVPPSSVRKTTDGIVCKFDQRNSYPTPISVKWTELNVDLLVRKSIRRLPRNRVRVTITVKNRQATAVNGLLVEDSYTPAQAQATARGGLRIVRKNSKDPRLVFQKRISLSGRQSLRLSYEIKAVGTSLSIPPTRVNKGSALVATTGKTILIPFPPAPPAPQAAFALPSGWSFDYMHGGDHHLNEHGMWCNGQNYDERHSKLSWYTGCIFADKNFDDDYRWNVTHQILRFNPGYMHHAGTSWLPKGNGSNSGSFQNDSLKLFSKVVVLLRGWRFDFTNKDRHINRIAVSINTTRFDQATGKVWWSTNVSYADKNFDDDFRYAYWYTILGFNGEYVAQNFAGTDHGGGTHTHRETIAEEKLLNYNNMVVVPVGWEFDYLRSDRHMNEHNFRIQNVRYNPNLGKVSWSAHLNYCDKNSDDPYSWRYHLLFLATNQGESRDYARGPYVDDGGLDSEAQNVDLNTLFTPITWTNGIKDGNETGIDCGGSSPARDFQCLRTSVSPGTAASSNLYSLKKQDQQFVVRTFATAALVEYAQALGEDFNLFYSGPHQADRTVEAIAWYVDQHMEYVSDSGSWKGAQSAYKTLTQSGHRGSKDFAGDCEDHAILRAALLRSLGFYHKGIFCADHHNSVNQGQLGECGGGKKGGGGHTYNIVIYKGKYRIMDYGAMVDRFWGNLDCWDQHATTNIWNDHTGKHWSRKDKSPYNSKSPLVNYPGNPSSPSSNWDWRTYYVDITP